MASRSMDADAVAGSGSNDSSLHASPLAGVRPSEAPVALKSRRRDNCSSDNCSGSSSDDNNSNHYNSSVRRRRSPRQAEIPVAANADRRALKKAVEKKFRLRYDSLQQAYEQRLRALAALVDGAVGQIQKDAAMQCLQESPLTLEFASARLGEIIQESFFGEREQYVKAMSDQIAWQASDLRELQQKLRISQRREGEARQQCERAQRDLAAGHRQLEMRVQELQEHKQQTERLEQKLADALESRDVLRTDVEKLKHAVQTLSGVQSEFKEHRERVQADQEKEAAARDSLARTVKELEEARNVSSLRALVYICVAVRSRWYTDAFYMMHVGLSRYPQKLELEKQASEQEAAHLRQLLHIANSKAHELSESLQDLQHQDFPARLARADAELEHHKQLIASHEKENEALRQRYEEFGAQVDQYMQEQAQEKAAVVAKHDEQLKRAEDQMDDIKRQAQEALRSKQQEVLRTTEQLKVRHDAFGRLEQKNSMLLERISALEAQVAEEKVRGTQHAVKLEKDIAQGRVSLEREQERLQLAKKALADMKEKYEGKIKSLQDALAMQNQQSVKEKELEARARWQSEFVAKQEARIEALKAKYDSALENQQNELVQARQAAVNSASVAAAKLESARTSLKQEEDMERLRRADTFAREQKRKEEEEADRVRLAAYKKTERNLDEREKRLLERERVVVEREAAAERRNQALNIQQKQLKDAAASAARATATASTPSAPNVVVLNVSAGDDANSPASANAIAHESGGKTINLVNKVPASTKHLGSVTGSDSAFVLRAQHEAELAAREAQVMLQAEERVKKLMREFEERKDNEFRAAMVNVRKGIHKLEAGLDEAKTEKKNLEEQLLNERQAFAILKQENEELRDSRGPIVQRLEEANENIGRLRAVVKQSRDKSLQVEEQLKEAQANCEQSTLAAQHLESALNDLQKHSEELERGKASCEASLSASESGRRELQDHVLSLEMKLREEREEFKAERLALGEQTATELRSTSVQYDAELQKVLEQVRQFQADNRESQERKAALEQELRNMREENERQKAAIERGRADLAQQRKEFADLARMHKNLKNSMDSSIEDERSKRIAAEKQSLELVKEVARVKHEKEVGARFCREKLRVIAREWNGMKLSVRSDLQLTWSQITQDVNGTGLAWQKKMDAIMSSRDSNWRQQAKQEKQEWKRRLAQKDSEMDAMLTSRRVTDQTKYDQLAHRMEQKTKEVDDLEARLSVQVELNTSLQQKIDAMERDAEYRQQESMAHQQLSSSAEAKAAQHQCERDAALASLEKWKTIADKLRAFVVSIGQDRQAGGGDPTVVSRVDFSPLTDGEWSENFNLRELSRQLGRIGALVRENGEKIVATAKQESSQPLVSELEAAKKCLEQYWRPVLMMDSDALDSDTSMASEDALFYFQHLPWFVAVDRAIVRMKKAHEEQLASLRSDITRVSTEKQVALDTGVQLQESINMLRFEKETLLREMEMLTKTMQKRKYQELLDQRAELERRMEQLKLHAERNHMKNEQDLESQVEQLRASIATERRATSNAKNDAITYRMELERVQEEFRDTQQRLEKQLDELRDTSNKWKRKAKIAMKATGSGAVSTANLLLSSASFSTEEDSDASYRSLLHTPRRRRPSRAMADLSSLMEQSLSLIRQEAVVGTPPRPSTASSQR